MLRRNNSYFNIEISKEQPDFLREYLCGCLPKCWGGDNYLTKWEFKCYEKFKTEIVNYDQKNKFHEKNLK